MGAKNRSLKEWAATIAEMQSSGMPPKEWCKSHGINLFSLRGAQTRLNKQAAVRSGKQQPFVGVEVKPRVSDVTLRCGQITVVASVSDAAALLKALAGNVSC